MIDFTNCKRIISKAYSGAYRLRRQAFRASKELLQEISRKPIRKDTAGRLSKAKGIKNNDNGGFTHRYRYFC